MSQWQFWVDRGGTFTDIVAISPDSQWHVKKLLSVNPPHYPDAALEGIRQLMGCQSNDPIPTQDIYQIRMGTTIATNALLERKGDRVGLLVTYGYRDVLKIGYQNRPDLFALNIELPSHLYECVEEIEERVSSQGDVILPCNLHQAKKALETMYHDGIRSIAIVFMHSYRNPQHEIQVAKLAQEQGFTEISLSSEVSPLMKIVSRGDTTVLDAYLSPLLNRYVNFLREELGDTPLYFMKSSGGLVHAEGFRSKHSILSGPAGGVVGAVQTSLAAGFKGTIGFDMGGTSTDVSHYDQGYEYQYESLVSGIYLRLPMLAIHTIAAGGGSIISFHQGRFQVGPESAGAQPGPVCYRQGGPLTITDCNVLLGKIQPNLFPAIFGEDGDLPLDAHAVTTAFELMQQKINVELAEPLSIEAIAEGFIRVAVMHMASAIKKISIQKGHDITHYVLSCFGGAGGQHACLVADLLGIDHVMVHDYASVLSAYGMGLADVIEQRQYVVEKVLVADLCKALVDVFEELESSAYGTLEQQGIDDSHIDISRWLHLKYSGTNNAIPIAYQHDSRDVSAEFEKQHEETFGFVMTGEDIVVEMVSLDAIGSFDNTMMPPAEDIVVDTLKPPRIIKMYVEGAWQSTAVYCINQLELNQSISGPALIIDDINTIVVEPGWEVQRKSVSSLVMVKTVVQQKKHYSATKPDPILLEVFNHLTMSIAEQMGEALVNTAYSVNIKERRDFSCALFDKEGTLIANAPHIPVHLGSMGESVKSIIHQYHESIRPGDVYMLNDPYHGGTHLPDITVITPVFFGQSDYPLFYVASRGHHADIGGITPGSMPALSKAIKEEGVVINNIQLVKQGEFLIEEVKELLLSGPYPARNVDRNITDLKAQVAANTRGVQALCSVCDQFGLDVVLAYMTFIQDNAERSVRELISKLSSGAASTTMDNGAKIVVRVDVSAAKDSVIVDFTGSSLQLDNNFNAPRSVTRAVVLYVFRTLVDTAIPLNDGCLVPVSIIVPDECFLNPQYPAAVVAGNVETSQALVDTLFAALGVLANSQGTMNNLTLGNDDYQYYETICGGAGAGDGFNGADAVQTHMTNSLLTDPEVLEHRYPLLLQQFCLRDHSGGDGHYQGGRGVIREIEFLEKMTINILSERRSNPPQGLFGAGDAQCGINEVIRLDGSVETLAARDTVVVYPGDRVRIQTPGGGGFGVKDK